MQEIAIIEIMQEAVEIVDGARGTEELVEKSFPSCDDYSRQPTPSPFVILPWEDAQ
jgi:hypothetical protein